MLEVATMLAPGSKAQAGSETVAAIAAFMRTGSIEATRPAAARRIAVSICSAAGRAGTALT